MPTLSWNEIRSRAVAFIHCLPDLAVPGLYYLFIQFGEHLDMACFGETDMKEGWKDDVIDIARSIFGVAGDVIVRRYCLERESGFSSGTI